ncbi:MAG: helix-turn-helix domain-containing protein [Eubacteriales bacterium]|nr:helix-turn-helix domain-containing protein [Eubacteriales bacterium]
MAKGRYEQWLEPEGLLKIEGWARDGLTDEQIAKNMGIAPKTLYRWKDSYSQICQSLKKGKEVPDREVENALYKNAIGYDYHEVTRERRFNKQTGKYEMIVTKDIIRHVAPSTTAQIFWLKNRKPEMWKDKQDAYLELDGKGVMIVDDIPKPEES